MDTLVMAVIAAIGFGVLGCAAAPEGGGRGLVGSPDLRAERIGVDGADYAYAVYRSPALPEGEPAPALLFLHGSGECGTDGEKMLAVGLPPAIREHPERWPFVVIVPQKPTSQSEWEDHGGAVLAILDREMEKERIDPARVAITGLSQGGHGTIAMVSRYPERFRAAAAVCGYVQPFWVEGERSPQGPPGPERAAELVAAFRGTPLRLYHGEKDSVVPAEESRWLARTLRDAGVEVGLTLYPDLDHNSWDAAYGDPDLARWLVEQTD
jgi:predicted peptidase